MAGPNKTLFTKQTMGCFCTMDCGIPTSDLYHCGITQHLMIQSDAIIVWKRTFPLKNIGNIINSTTQRHLLSYSQYWNRHTLQVKMLVTQSCLPVCDPMACGPPGSSVHGISQARILEWVAIAFSRGSFQPRDWTRGSLNSSPIKPTPDCSLWMGELGMEGVSSFCFGHSN